MAFDSAPYVDDELQMGRMLSRLLNPPADDEAQPASATQSDARAQNTTAPPSPASSARPPIPFPSRPNGTPAPAPAPSPRPAPLPAAAGPIPAAVSGDGTQSRWPELVQRRAAGPASSGTAPGKPPAQPATTPAAPPLAPELASTANPSGTAAPPGTGAATGDYGSQYVRPSLDAAMDAFRGYADTVRKIQSRPSIDEVNAPIEQKRISDSAQTPYRDPQTGQVLPRAEQFKPKTGTRIMRGLRGAAIGLMTGGIPGAVVGAIEPQDIQGGKAYGAPNRAYDETERQRTERLASDEQQMKRNADDYNAESKRLGDLASLQRSEATTALNLGKEISGQETAEEKARHDQELEGLRRQVNDLRSQGKAPQTYEQAVIASLTDPDPAKRQAYGQAARQLQETEVKRFQFANRNSGAPNDDRRQAMIDSATAQVQAIQDKYQYDPDTNRYFDPNEPTKLLSPEEFTDLKNGISAKLDAALTRVKMKPLGVRFNPADAGANKDKARAAQPTPASSTRGQQQPSHTTAPISKYIGPPTDEETARRAVAFGPHGEKIAYRGGAWRDVTTGQEVR